MKNHAGQPFVLDENIDSLDMLLRGKADLAMYVVKLKISRLGGLTKTKQARDLCVSMGIAMTLEDSWGGDIATAGDNADGILAQSVGGGGGYVVNEEIPKLDVLQLDPALVGEIRDSARQVIRAVS